MNIPLILAFLFFAGALLGYILEFFFRNLISHSGPRGKYFINPGFCKGPYLPIYGVGLTTMFCITYTVDAYLDNPPAIVIIIGIVIMGIAVIIKSCLFFVGRMSVAVRILIFGCIISLTGSI